MQFCLDDLFIDKSGVLQSPTISEGGSVRDLSCCSVSFMNLDALVFDVEMLRIYMFSW